MINILKIGENTWHPGTYSVDRPAGHPVFLLLFVKTQGDFLIDNEWQTIEPVTALLFQPGQRHLYHGIEDSYVDSWMHLTFPESLLGHHFPYGQPIPIPNPEEYDVLVHLMAGEFYGSKPHREEVLDSLASVLLTRLSDECHAEAYPAIYYGLSELRKHIYTYPEEEYAIEPIADKLGISVGYFHALYRKYFHTTCIADVVKSRLQSAADYLRSTNLGVEEIALRCGYNHAEHFIRQFKKEYGITPLKYRG